MNINTIFIHDARHAVWQCKTCGVWATCPEVVYQQHFLEGGYCFCPNGHSWGWSQQTCEREKLRQERDRLKQSNARLEEEANLAVIRAEKAETAHRKLKKRASAGTCPCCSRTFANMATHMKRQHPEFVLAGGAKIVPFKAETIP